MLDCVVLRGVVENEVLGLTYGGGALEALLEGNTGVPWW